MDELTRCISLMSAKDNMKRKLIDDNAEEMLWALELILDYPNHPHPKARAQELVDKVRGR